MPAAPAGWRALRRPQKLFPRWTWERWDGVCFLGFSESPLFPKGLVCWGSWGFRAGGPQFGGRRSPQSAGQGVEEKAGTFMRRGRCSRTRRRSKSQRRVWRRSQIRQRAAGTVRGFRRARVTRVRAAAGRSGGCVAGAGPDHRQGRRSRGHKGRALEVSCRTCRRDWGSSSQPAAATHYRQGGDTAGAKRQSWDLELGYK